MNKNKAKFQQGDLLSVTLTDAGGNKYIQTPVRAWLLITEVSVTGKVTTGNVCLPGQNGYGAVTWPKFRLHLLIRGRHGHTSPFAAMQDLKQGTGLQAFVNEK